MILFSALRINDQQAICNALHLPLPTPDIDLDTIIAQEKMHPAEILARLDRIRTTGAMVAAAVLRGRITKCPDDMQLRPQPYPKAPVRDPKTAAEMTRQRIAARSAPVGPNPNRTLVSFVPNPKREGSEARDRYAHYEIGLNEAQLLAKGLRRSDFRHDTQHGFIIWSE